MVAGRIEDPHFSLRPGNALLAAGQVLIQPNTAGKLLYVLSGFVLAASWQRNPHMLAWAVRRLTRLLPVMWASILLAAMLAAVAALICQPPYTGATGWFHVTVADAQAISTGTLLANLAGLSHSINSVLWSVQVELAMVLLLPPLVELSRRTTPAEDLAMLVTLCVASHVLRDVAPSCVVYAYCFYLGIMLPKLIASRAARILGDGRVLLASLALLVPIELAYHTGRLWMPHKSFANTIVCAHLLAFVLLRPDARGAGVLDHPWLIRLGDVSYSFYAYSMALLIAAASIALRLVPAAWCASDLGATAITLAATAASVAGSLVLASWSYAHIERPWMDAGRAWAARGLQTALPSAATRASNAATS
jgi:peptidoglycan/LPS O-acetylase OafA/YrhL